MKYAGKIQLSTNGSAVSKVSDSLAISTGVNVGANQFVTDKGTLASTPSINSIDVVNGGQDRLSISNSTLLLGLNPSLLQSGIMEAFNREIFTSTIGSASGTLGSLGLNDLILIGRGPFQMSIGKNPFKMLTPWKTSPNRRR